MNRLAKLLGLSGGEKELADITARMKKVLGLS